MLFRHKSVFCYYAAYVSLTKHHTHTVVHCLEISRWPPFFKTKLTKFTSNCQTGADQIQSDILYLPPLFLTWYIFKNIFLGAVQHKGKQMRRCTNMRMPPSNNASSDHNTHRRIWTSISVQDAVCPPHINMENSCLLHVKSHLFDLLIASVYGH